MKELIIDLQKLITTELNQSIKIAQNRRATIAELTEKLTEKIADDSATCYSKEIVRVTNDLHEILSNIRFFTHVGKSIEGDEDEHGITSLSALKYLHKDVKRFYHNFEPCPSKYDLIVDCILSHY